MLDFSSIFAVLFTITVGLLFIDLVALQENAVCQGNYSNATTCPEVYHAQSYFSARDKFIDAARSAKAEMESHEVYREDDVSYTINTAFLPGKMSKRLLVHISGTHGVEGYSGSALQVKLLREWNSSRGEGPSVLFVHALNPYGMAHFRRFNEKNVDLNRNYFSKEEWKEILARDSNVAGYDDIRNALLYDRAPRLFDRYLFFVNIIKAAIKLGITGLKRSIVSGQYHDPNGIFFGGREEQLSTTFLRMLLTKYSAGGLEESIMIDVHTGLGPEGIDTMMVDTDKEMELAQKIFTAKVQSNRNSNSGAADGYNVASGLILSTELLGKNTLRVTEEFGTVHVITAARAIILENAAYNFARGSFTHEVMKSWLRDAFYPQKLAYKMAVLKRGTEAFDSSWKHLARK